MVETFQALADPNRLRILELLASGPQTVGSVAGTLGLRQPQASKHLKALRTAGLVVAQADAQRRVYGIRAEPLRGVDHWLTRYRRLWEEQFEKLDGLLEELQAAPAPSAAKIRNRIGTKR